MWLHPGTPVGWGPEPPTFKMRKQLNRNQSLLDLQSPSKTLAFWPSTLYWIHPPTLFLQFTAALCGSHGSLLEHLLSPVFQTSSSPLRSLPRHPPKTSSLACSSALPEYVSSLHGWYLPSPMAHHYSSLESLPQTALRVFYYYFSSCFFQAVPHNVRIFSCFHWNYWHKLPFFK